MKILVVLWLTFMSMVVSAADDVLAVYCKLEDNKMTFTFKGHVFTNYFGIHRGEPFDIGKYMTKCGNPNNYLIETVTIIDDDNYSGINSMLAIAAGRRMYPAYYSNDCSIMAGGCITYIQPNDQLAPMWVVLVRGSYINLTKIILQVRER